MVQSSCSQTQAFGSIQKGKPLTRTCSGSIFDGPMPPSWVPMQTPGPSDPVEAALPPVIDLPSKLQSRVQANVLSLYSGSRGISWTLANHMRTSGCPPAQPLTTPSTFSVKLPILMRISVLPASNPPGHSCFVCEDKFKISNFKLIFETTFICLCSLRGMKLRGKLLLYLLIPA